MLKSPALCKTEVRNRIQERLHGITTYFRFFPFPSAGSSTSIASLSLSLSLSARGPVGGENDILVASRLPNLASRCFSKTYFSVALSSLSYATCLVSFISVWDASWTSLASRVAKTDEVVFALCLGSPLRCFAVPGQNSPCLKSNQNVVDLPRC